MNNFLYTPQSDSAKFNTNIIPLKKGFACMGAVAP